MVGKGKKVVVTGSSGHIGYNVALQLIEKSFEVHLLVRRQNINVFKLEQKGAIVHTCDLFKPETYQNYLKDIHAAYHLAAENTTSKSNSDKTILNTVG